MWWRVNLPQQDVFIVAPSSPATAGEIRVEWDTFFFSPDSHRSFPSSLSGGRGQRQPHTLYKNSTAYRLKCSWRRNREVKFASRFSPPYYDQWRSPHFFFSWTKTNNIFTTTNTFEIIKFLFEYAILLFLEFLNRIIFLFFYT